jgi:hypothetical protein
MAVGHAVECRDIGLLDLRRGDGNEAPRQTVALLQHCLLACVPFALIGAVVMHALRE